MSAKYNNSVPLEYSLVLFPSYWILVIELEMKAKDILNAIFSTIVLSLCGPSTKMFNSTNWDNCILTLRLAQTKNENLQIKNLDRNEEQVQKIITNSV